MKYRTLYAFGVLLLILAPLVKDVGAAAPVTWIIQTVDIKGSGCADTSLVLDAAGRPHISYLAGFVQSPGPCLKYAHYNGASWRIQTVNEGIGLAGVGFDSSLALDAAGNPHIAYWGKDPSQAKYARYDDSSWHIETLGKGVGTSLALDRNGHPHIAYQGQGLIWTYWNGQEWKTQTVDRESAGYPCLALDAFDHPHIVYQGHYLDLKYAYYDGADWWVDTVDNQGDVGSFPSLALDPSGQPYISYAKSVTNEDWNLKYAFSNGSTWQIETVDSQGTVGRDSALALDSFNQPHIAYHQPIANENGYLKYAYRVGDSWQIERVDASRNVGSDTSLVLDHSGQPHVSYCDNANDVLKYAYRQETLTLPQAGVSTPMLWLAALGSIMTTVGLLLRRKAAVRSKSR